jgi:hypothetical protein
VGVTTSIWIRHDTLRAQLCDKVVPPLEVARDAVGGGDTSRRPEIASDLTRAMRLLSEDPYVPISLGQRPIVLDAYMLWNIARSRSVRDRRRDSQICRAARAVDGRWIYTRCPAA